MSQPVVSSISVASLFFCLCLGVSDGNCRTTETDEGGQNVPAVRSPIVGGTAFPSLDHYDDPSTRSEVWSVSPPDVTDKTGDASQPSMYISPEIHLTRPDNIRRPHPRQSLRERP